MKTLFIATVFAVSISWTIVVPRALADDKVPQSIRAVLGEYVAIQKALAADSMEHVAHHASAIAEMARNDPDGQLPKMAAAQAGAVAKAKDIKSAREAFKDLSKTCEVLVNGLAEGQGDYRVAYCPMAKAGWVQTGQLIANPYYGKSMLKCGTFKR